MPDPPRPKVLIVDTVFWKHYVFNDRTTNQRILREYSEVHSTELVAAEVKKKFGKTLPTFVITHNVPARARDPLSAADNSLLKLQEEFRQLGFDALLVTFDTDVVKASNNALFGDQFFKRMGLQHPNTRAGPATTAPTPAKEAVRLIQFRPEPVLPRLEREIRLKVSTRVEAENVLAKARRVGFKPLGDWKVNATTYDHPDLVLATTGETLTLENRSNRYVVIYTGPDTLKIARDAHKQYQTDAKYDAAATLSRLGYSSTHTRSVNRKGMSRGPFRVFHEEEAGDQYVRIEAGEDALLDGGAQLEALINNLGLERKVHVR